MSKNATSNVRERLRRVAQLCKTEIKQVPQFVNASNGAEHVWNGTKLFNGDLH